MSPEVTIEGVTYISSKRAAEIAGYSQDYVGQLARSGKIVGKRIGGLWYVLADSVLGHKKVADAYVPTQPTKEETLMPSDDASTVTLEGKQYVSASRAAKLTSYHQDYIGQLSRTGKILSKQVGKRWYVDIEALKAHKSEKDALLAAVQVDSVGIKKAVDEDKEDKVTSLAEEVGLHYAYTPDTKPLFPAIAERKEINKEDDVRLHDEYGSKGVESNSIPIRVVRPIARPTNVVSQPVSDRKVLVRTSRLSIFSKIFPVFVVTVLAVLIYNLNPLGLPDIIKSNAMHLAIEERLQTAVDSLANWGEWLDKRLQVGFSKEIRYSRGEL